MDTSARDSLIDSSTAKFVSKSKKWETPLGAHTTAMGLPKAKRIKFSKSVAFHQKDIQSRQRQILRWLVDENIIDTVMKGKKTIGEEDVEQDVDRVGSSIRDSHVDFNVVRRYFDEDAWTAATHVYEQ